MRFRRILSTAAAGLPLLALIGLAATAQPARADVSVEGGALVTRGETAGFGGLSLGLFGVPLAPVSGELTVVGSSGVGYAATLDARLGLAGTTVGAGAGVGTLGNASSTSVIYDGLVAQQIFPHTSIEARLYFGPNRPSSLLAGLRFSF